MNISIVGAGAMGSLFGGLLAESGHAVTLIDVNDAHLDAIRREGLHLETDAGSRRIGNLAVCRPELAQGQPDLLILFTKTLHSAAALTSVSRLLGPHGVVLSLQNGLGNAETIACFVSPERVMIGMTTWPADLAGPGHVRSHGQGVVKMMTADGVERLELRSVVDALSSAGLHCAADPAVWKAIWEKVAFNAALNSICAVTGCTVDQLGAAPAGFELAEAVVDEVVAVAHSAGIQADARTCKASVSKAIEEHAGHKPSMLQDVLAGRRTEIDAINGAVVAMARKHDVPVPHTRTLLGLVQLIEARTAGRKAAATPTHIAAIDS